MVYMLMAVSAILFAVTYLILGFNNRLAADDFHYLVKTKELGIWDSTLFYYDNWNPRWSASLVRGAFLKYCYSANSLFAFHVLTLLFGWYAVYSFLNALVSNCKLPIKLENQAIIALYFLASMFYTAFNKGDTWFWLSSTPSYLWGSFALLFGGSLLIRKVPTILRYSLIMVLFGYAGASSEAIALAGLAILFYLGFITHGKKLLIQIDRKALHLATLVCFIAFSTTLISNGTHVRIEHLPQYGIQDKLMVALWNYVKFTFIEIPLVLPIVFLFALPFAFFGRKQLQFQLISIKEVFWANRKLWGATDITVALLAFSLAMVMGEMGPERAWLPISVMVLILAIAIFYQLGTWAYIKTKGRLYHIVLVGQLVLIGYQATALIWQTTLSSRYATSVDRRMELAYDKTESCEGIIELEPLCNSGWLFSAEITTDTAHFTNQHLGLFFGKRCNFVVKQDVTSTSE